MKRYLKFLFYRGLCPFLLFIGFDKFLRRVSGYKNLIIMYHGVSRDTNPPINGRHLPVDQFEKQLVYFRKHFNVIPLTDLCDMALKGIRPEKHTIALTFDDGYLNNISNALPLLKKYQIPATFFISSVSLDEQDYVHPSDYLDLINFYIDESVEVNGKLFRKDKYHLVASANRKWNIYQYINSLSLSLWEKTLSDLSRKYRYNDITAHVSDETYKLITGSTLSVLLSEDLINIGSHGHWHVNLAMLSEDEIREQLTRSKAIFNKHGLKPVETLAFPYGYFNDKVLSLCRDHGHKYLIAGGRVDKTNRGTVFPRIGILNLAGFAFNILSINRGFGRFGF